MIRALAPAETRLIVPIGYAFSQETGNPELFGFDGEAFCATWGKLIELGAAVILAEFDPELGYREYPAGAIGGIAAPNDKDGLLGVQECFWFVHRDYRRRGGWRLVEALEAWARERGAVRMSMTHLAHMSASRLGQLYEERGYQPIEVNYMKRLDREG